MILKCEYCKTHTAYSPEMKLECINCGASLRAMDELHLYSDQIVFSRAPIRTIQLSGGMNYIEYNPEHGMPEILRMQSNF
jgi:hypothetical protein